MAFLKNTNLSDRLKTARDAKAELVARFSAKPTVTAEQPIDRKAERESELKTVRLARASERKATAEKAAEELAAGPRREAEAAAAVDEAEAAVLREQRKIAREARYAAAGVRKQD